MTELIEQVKSAIAAKDCKALNELAGKVDPRDIAELIVGPPPEEPALPLPAQYASRDGIKITHVVENTVGGLRAILAAHQDMPDHVRIRPEWEPFANPTETIRLEGFAMAHEKDGLQPVALVSIPGDEDSEESEWDQRMAVVQCSLEDFEAGNIDEAEFREDLGWDLGDS